MREIEAVSIVGLGKLGLCMAACFANKGYKVIGIDIDEAKLDLINNGKNPINETDLTELVEKCGGNNLCATNNYRETILNSQVTFIVVATPSQADGSFSNRQLEESLKQIGKSLKSKDDYHVVVITSTVMPGTTEHVGKFILEQTSGKKCGTDFGLVYNPEFIALGSVIHDFLNPDFILIGEANTRDGKLLENIYRDICDNEPRFARMNPVNAEIAKISLNCYVTMKITYANSLAAVCEKVAGADAETITNAIGLDTRIGRKYLRPGLGYGGPCFPRDNVAFTTFARKVNVRTKLAETVDEVNRNQIRRIITLIQNMVSEMDLKKDSTVVGVLGLSYKPNTPIIEDSQAIDIVDLLINEGFKIVVYDPQALEFAKGVFGNAVTYAKDSRQCVQQADIVLISTPWDEFKNIDITDTKKAFLDCWGLFKNTNTNTYVKHIGQGKQTFPKVMALS